MEIFRTPGDFEPRREECRASYLLQGLDLPVRPIKRTLNLMNVIKPDYNTYKCNVLKVLCEVILTQREKSGNWENI